jgi:thiol-disulfide isomerase/thioredoxin
MAGNDEHKCTGACGGSTEAVAAGMAGNDAMANGKDKAYRVGSKVNDFTATHAQTGASASLSGVAGSKATVLIFWNQNCPYVVEMVDRVDAFAKDYASKGVSVVAVDAGVNNTKDSVMAHAKDRAFPVMINEDSKVAAQFAASRTPEVFILDGDMNVVYHGAFDSGKENTPGSREHYAKVAVDEVLGGKAVSVKETRAFGCSLKYAKDAKPLPTS